MTKVRSRDAGPPYPEYANNPLGFFTDVLGIKPWTNPSGRHGQDDIIRAVGSHKSVTVRSGHKTGKSTSAAGLAWWWWATRESARAVMTAPTDRQIRKVAWRELRRLQRGAKRPLVADVPKDPGTGVLSPDGREIFGFSASDPDAFSGISGANVLYLADEASGISEDIFEALEGNRAGGAFLAMFGNPTQPSGTFFDSHHTARHLYHCLHVDSEDAAEFGGGIPGLATKEWCEEKRQLWPVGTPLHDVRVKGNFARESTNTVISLSLIEAARARWDDVPEDGLLSIGVDVAREGDDETVIQPRRGNKLLDAKHIRSMDGIQVAGAVLSVARSLSRKGEPRPRVKVDVIGVGASVVDQLAYHHGDEVECIAVNVAKASDQPDKYHNLRTQLHYGMRDWLRSGGALQPDEQLESDLVAARYKFDAQGRLQVEKKDEIKKRLGRSPDRADAAQLAVYDGGYSEMRDMPVVQSSRWDDAPGRGFG